MKKIGQRTLSVVLMLVMLLGMNGFTGELGKDTGDSSVEVSPEFVVDDAPTQEDGGSAQTAPETEASENGEKPDAGESDLSDISPSDEMISDPEDEQTSEEPAVVEAEEAALGLMPGMSLTALAENSPKEISRGESYYIGDSITSNASNIYVRYDDDSWADYIGVLLTNQTATVPTPTYDSRCEQWVFDNFLKVNVSNEFTAWTWRITGSNAVAPIGFKCAGGTGTKSDPFTFEGIYPPHTHSFTYTAEGATITATCTAAGCDLTDSKVTLKIVPNSVLYYDDGQPKEASLEGLDAFNAATGKSITTDDISYYKGDANVTAQIKAGSGTSIKGATYTARLDVEGVRAVATFSLTAKPKPHTHSFTYAANGNVITATCNGTDGTCDLTNRQATLTLNAPAHQTYGDGLDANATLVGEIPGVDAPTIHYSRNDTPLSTAPTDAGTYTAWCQLGNATASVEYTVNKAAADFTTLPQAITGLVYTGVEQELITAGTTSTGQIAYTVGTDPDHEPDVNAGGMPYSYSVPKMTDAGTYYVWYKLDGGKNYESIAAQKVEATIARADIAPVVSIEGWTYGKTANAPGVTGNTGNGAVTYTYSDKEDGTYSETVPTDAGTYYVKAAIAETDNYNAATTAPVSFTIAKAEITITPDDKSSKYGEDIAPLTYQVGGDYVSGDELGVTLNTTATKTSDVGEYEITVSWNNNSNYTATLNTGKYTVTKTDLTVTATGYSGAYDGTAHGITVEVGGSDAVVYYATEELTAENYTTAGSTIAPTRTDAGTTTVYYYVEGKNYDAVSGSMDVEITKADGAAATPAEISMWDAESANVAAVDGQEYVIVPKGGTPDWTKAVEGKDGNVAFADLTPATEYEIYTRVKEDANHNPGEAVKTDLLTSLFGLEMMDELYVGETITVVPDPADAEGLSYQWYYAEDDDGAVTRGEIIEGADRASYTIQPADHGKTLWVEITKNGIELDNADYGPVEKREIEPAVVLEGWAANETAKTPNVTGNTGNGAVTYTYAVKGSTDFSATVPTAAGDYTVKATIAESDRYYGGEATADFTIQAVYTVKFSTGGGTEIKDQTVVAGEKAAKPADPEKNGNEFSGWYQDATFAVAFDFNTPITADVTIYAKWTAIEAGEVDASAASGAGAPAAAVTVDKTTLVEAMVKNGVLTAAEAAEIENGADLNILVEVNDATSTMDAADKAAIESAARGMTVGQLLDIDLYKLLTVNGVAGEKTQITTSGEALKITLTLPDSMKNTDAGVSRTYYIVRVHDGKAEILDTAYNAQDGTLTFETDQFSSYAIVYQDSKPEATAKPTATAKPDAAKSGSPKTGDESGAGLWLAVMALCAFGLGGMIVNDKKRRKVSRH